MSDTEKALRTELDRIQAIVSDRNSGFDVNWNNDEGKWVVEVEESDDHHLFVNGHGPTPEAAAALALQRIPDALIFWGWDDAIDIS